MSKELPNRQYFDIVGSRLANLPIHNIFSNCLCNWSFSSSTLSVFLVRQDSSHGSFKSGKPDPPVAQHAHP